jgi:2-polyprenyl-6-methoxyphenol hydroxylase-like FAD-dependent oxidoreductase
MRVIIVGGGIAGLSAALSLHQIGVDCRVYEAVAKLEPVGHGINLQPNAVRELTALGLGEQLADVGLLTAELAFYNRHGQLIWTSRAARPPVTSGRRFRSRAASCRKSCSRPFMRVWVDRRSSPAISSSPASHSAVTRSLPSSTIRPAGRWGEAQGDLLIGADGIHSAVRRHFYPGEAAVFDGYLHYRGIVEGDSYLTGRIDGGRRPSQPSRHHLSHRGAAGRQGADQLARLHEDTQRSAAARGLGYGR